MDSKRFLDEIMHEDREWLLAMAFENWHMGVEELDRGSIDHLLHFYTNDTSEFNDDWTCGYIIGDKPTHMQFKEIRALRHRRMLAFTSLARHLGEEYPGAAEYFRQRAESIKRYMCEGYRSPKGQH